MTSWPTPAYTRKKVTRAGAILASDGVTDFDDWLWATEVLKNWRSCHGYPINTFQATLRSKLKNVDERALVAQRLKRAPSIIQKLRRTPGMQLARMQDIGGIRAVVSDQRRARLLVEDYNNSRFQHELVREDDYISRPKESGYRSLHLVYRYKNDAPSAAQYQGLLIELQVRTRIQHAWATAVETVGTFLDEPLKASEGPEEWLSFFALASSAFAYLESTQPVLGFEGLDAQQTFDRVAIEAAKLDVQDRLAAFTIAAQQIATDKQAGSYHLVVLDVGKKKVHVQSFGQRRLHEASEMYSDYEAEAAKGDRIQVVLVSTKSIDQLRKAYPSFFLDTGEFVKQLRRVVKRAG